MARESSKKTGKRSRNSTDSHAVSGPKFNSIDLSGDSRYSQGALMADIANFSANLSCFMHTIFDWYIALSSLQKYHFQVLVLLGRYK